MKLSLEELTTLAEVLTEFVEERGLSDPEIREVRLLERVEKERDRKRSFISEWLADQN